MQPLSSAQAFVVAVLILISSGSSAATYKCTGPDGSTSFTDTPCDPKATQQVIVAPASRAPPVQSTAGSSPTPESIAATRDRSARETSALLCVQRNFNDWVKSQGHPLPEPDIRRAKYTEISNQCRRPLGLPDIVDVPGTPAKPVLSGPAGEAAASTLLQLVKSGSIERLRSYLSTPGVDINDRPGTDEALLDYAAEQNQGDVARFLLEHGAHVNAYQTQGPNRGMTALHRAAIADAADVAQLLLAHGAEVNVHGPLGITPLILAASNGSRRTAEVLLNHGADIAVFTGHRDTALSEATAHGHMDIARLLLQHVPAPTTASMNALAARGDLEALRLILMHDEVAHDVGTGSKNEALRLAIFGGIDQLQDREQIIELLLAHGADIDNRVNNAPNIPLMGATTPEMAEFLLARGANRKMPETGSALAAAFSCNRLAKDPIGLINVLVSHQIDINGGAPGGIVALSCAVRANQPALVEALLSHGVPVDAADANARTALFAATDRTMVELLLKHGAHIDALDRFNQTPLAVAAAAGNSNLVATFTALGAGTHAGASGAAPPAARVSAAPAASAPIDPRIAEIRDAIVDLRATIENQMLDGLTALATKQVAQENASWNAHDPKWARVFEAIRVDLRADLAPAMADTLASVQEVWNRVLAASLSDADITQLLRFFRSDQGQRYIHFQRALDAIVNAAGSEMVMKIISAQSVTAPTTQDKNDKRNELLGYSLSMQMGQRSNAVSAQGAGGVSPRAVLTSIANLAVSTHGTELDAVRLQYQRDLDGFAAFNKSSLLERVLSASETATQQLSTAPGQRMLAGAVASSLSKRMPAWRIVYESDDPQGTAPASSAAIKTECLALENMDNSHQPPDIYRDVRECINQDKYPEAAALFALAGIESQFDAARVSDKTAGQAGQVLIMGTFDGLPQAKRDQFGTTVGNLAADRAALRTICARVSAIGYPTYYPAYMIQHGMGAVMAALGGKEQGLGVLDPAFDARKTWSTLQVTYLKCPSGAAASPDVPTPRASIMGNRTEVTHKLATLHDPGALFVTFSADSAKVVTADSFHDTLRVWTWQHGDPTNHSLTMSGNSGLSLANIAIAFSRDGRFIAASHDPVLPDKTKLPSQTNSSCRTIQIWNANTEKPLIDLDDLPEWCSAGGVAFSNDGALLFVIEHGPQLCPDKTDHVAVFSTADWKRSWNICVEGNWLGQLAVSPDNKLIAIGGYRNVKLDQSARPNAPMFESREVVAIVDIQARRTVRIIDGALPDHFEIEALAWSPDGRRLAVGGGNRRGDSRTDALKIYDPSSGALVLSENSEYSDIRGIAYTSDGKYFIEGVVNKEVRIWDGSHEHLLQTFPTGWGSPFADVLTALAVSPDNRYLAVTQSGETTLYEFK